MKILAGVVLAVAAAAPAAAQPLAFSVDTSTPNQTTFTRADARTFAAAPGSVTVPGLTGGVEASPDGSQLAVVRLGLAQYPAIASAITFADTASGSVLGDSPAFEGNPTTEYWTTGGKLLVVSDRDRTGVTARVLTLDPATQAVTGSVDLGGAPGDTAVVGDRFVVLDTNMTDSYDITPNLKVFAPDGTLERTIGLGGLASATAPRLTRISLAAQGDTLVAFAGQSGRYATVDVTTGTATVTRTRLASTRAQRIVAITRTRFTVARQARRSAIHVVDRRTGKTTQVANAPGVMSAGMGYLSQAASVLKKPRQFKGVRRFDARGRLTWTALQGRLVQTLTTHGDTAYAITPDQRLHAISLQSGKETGSTTSAVLTEADGSYTYPYSIGGGELGR